MHRSGSFWAPPMNGSMVQESVAVKRLSSVVAAETREWRSVRELCCRTGNNGEPVSLDRWESFGRLWIEPYERILPQWTYVAEVRNGVVAYLTGCPNTRIFERARRWHFALPVLIEIVLGSYPRSRDALRFVLQSFRLEKRADASFSSETRRVIQRDYPSHLHMNVEAPWRRIGIGKKLLKRYSSDLRTVGATGIHLYCGADPLGFYLSEGFTELDRIVFQGRPVYALGHRL